MHLIDAVALEREGWYINRIIQTGKTTMEYQTKKPTEFHAIEPEQKPGEWKEREVHNEKVIEEWQSARCSVCGKYHTTPYLYYFNEYKYCPNCGAPMRGKQNG